METTNEIPCPKCNKKNVLVSSPTTSSIIKWLIYFVIGGAIASLLTYVTGKFIVGLIVMIILGIIVKSFPNVVRIICQECGHKWWAYF